MTILFLAAFLCLVMILSALKAAFSGGAKAVRSVKVAVPVAAPIAAPVPEADVWKKFHSPAFLRRSATVVVTPTPAPASEEVGRCDWSDDQEAELRALASAAYHRDQAAAVEEAPRKRNVRIGGKRHRREQQRELREMAEVLA